MGMADTPDTMPNEASRPAATRRFDPVLAGIVIVTAVVGALIVSAARNWALMTDELLYTGMARSMAQSLLPLPEIRGAAAHVNQVLFPLLIAPLVGALRMPAAYPWIAVVNAAVFASAAIPAYLLASHATGSRAAARWVAACTIVTPWLSFSSKALPDATAYAALLWAAYAIVRTARGPSDDTGTAREAVRGDCLVLLAILAAYLARNQFLLLAAVWPAVVVAAAAARASIADGAAAIPRALVRLPLARPLPFVLLIAVLLLLALDSQWLLGVYSITATGARGGAAPGGVVRAFFEHLSFLQIALAGIPVVLGLPWLLAALTRASRPRQFDTAVTILLLTGAIVYVGASFDVRFTEFGRVTERYVFYAGPLILIAMAGMLTDPPRRAAAYFLPALAGILLVDVSKPYGLDSPLTWAINHAFSPTQIVLIKYQQVADTFGISISALLLVLVLSWLVAVWWLQQGGRDALALNGSFALLLVVLAATTLWSAPKLVDFQNRTGDALLGQRGGEQKAWIDTAVDGAPVSMVYSPRLDVASRAKVKPVERVSNWWDLAFWNGSIARVYVPVADPRALAPFPGATERMLPDWRSGALERVPDDDAQAIVMAESNPMFAPQHRGQAPRVAGYVLYDTGRAATAAWATRGLTNTGWLPAAGATLRVYAPSGATAPTELRVRLTIATPDRDVAGLGALRIAGASAVRSFGGDGRRSFDWRLTVKPHGYVDFRLRPGAPRTHIDLIAVAGVATPGSGQ